MILRAELFHKGRNRKAMFSWSRRWNYCPYLSEELSSPGRAVVIFLAGASVWHGSCSCHFVGHPELWGLRCRAPGLCIPAHAPGHRSCCLGQPSRTVHSRNLIWRSGLTTLLSKRVFLVLQKENSVCWFDALSFHWANPKHHMHGG